MHYILYIHQIIKTLLHNISLLLKEIKLFFSELMMMTVRTMPQGEALQLRAGTNIQLSAGESQPGTLKAWQSSQVTGWTTAFMDITLFFSNEVNH